VENLPVYSLNGLVAIRSFVRLLILATKDAAPKLRHVRRYTTRCILNIDHGSCSVPLVVKTGKKIDINAITQSVSLCADLRIGGIGPHLAANTTEGAAQLCH
jgi:hypothetical protein